MAKANENAPKDDAKTTKKSNKGLILGLSLGGGVLVITGIIVLIIILFMGGKPKNSKDFAKAAEEKKAVNCVITSDDSEGESVEFVANEGWSSIYVSSKKDDGDSSNILIIDSEYLTWIKGEEKGYSYKNIRRSAEAIAKSYSEYKEDDGKELSYKCKRPAGDDSRLEKPSDVKFKDLSDMYESYYK